MALLLLSSKSAGLKPLPTPHLVSRIRCFCSKVSSVVDEANSGVTTTEAVSVHQRQRAAGTYSTKTTIHLSPLLSDGTTRFNDYNIEVVDDKTWQVSSGLAHAWRRWLNEEMEAKPGSVGASGEKFVDGVGFFRDDPDFDEIDDKRIRGDLFYKLDRDSKEFEEYSFDFHRKRKIPKSKNVPLHEKETSKNNDNNCKGSKMKENPIRDSSFEVQKLPQILKNDRLYTLLHSSGGCEKKKVRAPTFNQLTGPYHEPFCLDIYISKASVRACVIHRVTSRVVAVAHSISKYMKLDLSSTRNPAACAAVGKILAQRALEDDVHDVVYTPRKGERLEGKLQIVLQSILDNGVNVKVKLKQKKPKKAGFPPPLS